MINAAGNSFRSRLLSKDKEGSLEYLNTNLVGEKLVSTLHDLIFFSVLVESSSLPGSKGGPRPLGWRGEGGP